MTSYYGDDPYAPQERSDGPGNGHRPKSQWRTNGRASVAPRGQSSDGLGPGGGASSAGRARVGSSSIGSASVGAASAGAAAGRAPAGRAAVRPAGFDSAGSAGLSGDFDPFADEAPPAGRASVGRAGVGRASVLAPEGPGGGAGGGPGGPGGTGPAGDPLGRAKRIRRRRQIIAGLAILIMLTGIGVITGVYYSSTITLPGDVPLQQSTTIYYSDGKTVMARIGEENRVILQDNQIPPIVKQAVTAAEDTSFYSNSGVDFKGIVRAFVNNVTGGDTQGASTITQQYARNVAKLTYSASYTRKFKEIVLAEKMTQRMTKDQILTNYLNIVNFGRGAYGIEAAAEAYFNVTAEKLQPNQAMVLAGMIKNPNGGVYDPTCGADKKSPCKTAIDRFNYIKSQMPKVPARPGYLNPDQISKLTYPTNAISERNNAVHNALATPKGFIVHHVMDELSHLKKADGTLVFPTTGPQSLTYGGYKIVTTIDKKAQQYAETAASGLVKGTPMYKMTKGIGAALVSVKPGTGAVVAYYGGRNGSDIDFAGIYSDPILGNGKMTNQSVKPGSSFKTITLAAALKQGISLNSYWYGPPQRDFKSRPGQPVNNAGTGEAQESCPGAGDICTLWKALQLSLNTVFYAVGEDEAKGMSAAKVIDMAYDLGIKHMWSDVRCHGKRFDLNGHNGANLASKCIGREVSFGGFNVTVQDMANVMATFANNGVRADEHFVSYVNQGFGSDQRTVFRTPVHLTPVPGYTSEMADDEQWAMQQVYKNSDEQDNRLDNDRPVAVKTGTWQLGDKIVNGVDQSRQNGSAFFNGYTAGDAKDGGIATSTWVGYMGKPMALRDQNGHKIGGASTPAAIWANYLNAYLNNGPGGRPYPIQQFAGLKNTGDPSAGERPSPAPTVPPQNPCDFQQRCGGGGGGGHGGGGGGGGPLPPPPTTQPPSLPPPPTQSQPPPGGGGPGGG